jgi:hypothetical protein
MPMRERTYAEASNVDVLPEDLSRLVVAVQEARSALLQAQAEHACRLALLARAANGRVVRQTSATRVCAAILGISRQTLQPYARVAGRWHADELHALLENAVANGAVLSRSHLEQLAKVPQHECRVLVDRAFTERLTVRGLKALIRGGGGRPFESAVSSGADASGRVEPSVIPTPDAQEALPSRR